MPCSARCTNPQWSSAYYAVGKKVESRQMGFKDLIRTFGMLGSDGIDGYAAYKFDEMASLPAFRPEYRKTAEKVSELIDSGLVLEIGPGPGYGAIELAKLQERVQIVCLDASKTMIEIARAALLAHEVAPEADFYSFGTNDLTQTTYGLSRDDAGRFLPYYVEQGIFEDDPFMTIDRKGVGLLMKMAIDSSRKIKKNMKMGICGEQVDPRSVQFCDEVGLTYVSGSPFRLPVARLAAAQATILKKSKKKDLGKATI